MPDFDPSQAHRYFAAHCFNAAWELIDKSDRTPEETEQMIQLALASLWHWSQREDGTPTHLSIGYWQASRVYALAGEPANAQKYAARCLEITPADDPFCLGYAHEAMSRAAQMVGDLESVQLHRELAREQAQCVVKPEDRQLLEDDLNSLEP